MIKTMLGIWLAADIVLKLVGTVTWSWGFVLLPLWIGLGLIFVGSVLYALFDKLKC